MKVNLKKFFLLLMDSIWPMIGIALVVVILDFIGLTSESQIGLGFIFVFLLLIVIGYLKASGRWDRWANTLRYRIEIEEEEA